MLTPAQRLVQYGFIKPESKKRYNYDGDKKLWVPRDPSKGYLGEDADQEVHEQATVIPAFQVGNMDYMPSGYPDTIKKYRLLYKSAATSMEETYYWLVDYYRIDMGFPHSLKITDIFSASEQSAFWGQAWSRLGIQQDRATQFMATIGKMVKDLFQLVRELRILEERLEIYEKAPESKSADVTLKGYYIDLVEGGAKNPSSVYGISQQVGFTILPDLFFNTHIYDANKVDARIDAMKWNDQVKNVLRRKLYSFLVWQDKTEKELKNRFHFTLRYLRQHWGIIKMYMNWVKPYLKNVQRMSMSEEHIQSVDIISAFETSMTEIEILFYKPEDKNGVFPCVLMSVLYRTQPEMSYNQEGYQHKGPIHVGEIEFQLRAYGWTQEDIDNFKRLKDDEDMDLIKLIDESIGAAMDALGDELKKYLELANEQLEKYGMKDDINSGKMSNKAARAVGSAIDPFTSVFRGFGEIFGAFGSFGSGKDKTKRKIPTQKERDKAADSILQEMYLSYKHYKKAHQMLSW